MDCIQLSLFGKTYPEPFPATTERTSGQFWKNLPAWSNQTLLFLDLRGGADGAKLEQSLETDGLWRGDSWTVNISEWPSAESVSLLSSTLEVNAPEKYYLSARACQGILTRASRRGKKLPDLLQTALLEMIEWWKRGGAEHSLYLENTFGMCGRRQGRAGTNGENRDAIDAPRPNTLPTDPGTDILHQRKYS